MYMYIKIYDLILALEGEMWYFFFTDDVVWLYFSAINRILRKHYTIYEFVEAVNEYEKLEEDWEKVLVPLKFVGSLNYVCSFVDI